MTVGKNSLLNIMGVTLPLYFAYFSIPELMETLKEENFALLLFMWSIVGYFGIFDFGVGKALVYKISNQDKNSYGEISGLIKAGLFIIVLTSMIGVLLLSMFAFFGIERWYEFESIELEDAVNAFALIAFSIIPTSISNGLRGALEGLNKFKESNINRTLVGTGMFLSPLVAVYFHGESLVMMALYLSMVRVLTMFFLLYSLRFYIFIKPNESLKINSEKILNYSMWNSLSILLGSLMIYGDRFVVGAVVGMASLSFYSTPQEGLMKLIVIPGAIASALFYDYASKRGEYDIKLKNKMFWSQAIIGTFMALIIIVIYIWAPVFLPYWIDEEFFEKSYTIIMIMSFGIFFGSIGLIPYTFLSSIGEVKIIGIVQIIQFPLFFILLYFLSKEFQLLGAAFAWSFRFFIDFLILQYFMSRHFSLPFNKGRS
jgi:O-antigen/teichoic acid export membrane protein